MAPRTIPKLIIFIFFLSVLAFHIADRNQLDDQHRLSSRPTNVATELGLLPDAEVDNNERGNQRRETVNSARQECGYAMLTPSTMTVIPFILRQTDTCHKRIENL